MKTKQIPKCFYCGSKNSKDGRYKCGWCGIVTCKLCNGPYSYCCAGALP